MAASGKARAASGPRRGKRGEAAAEHLQAIVDDVFDAIITIDQSATVLSFNPAAERLFGYGANEVIGENAKMLMAEPYRSEHDGYLGNYLNTGKAKIIGIGPREVRGRHKDGTEFPIDLAITEMRVGKHRRFIGVLRDITERKEAERVIREQSKAIQELSTPVIQVWDQVVLLPIIGTVDSQRAQQIIGNLLEAIVSMNARVAILDVTGMPVIDTDVAQHLMRTVAAAEMLGAEVVITGIRPEIAQTLIKLDVTLDNVHTRGTLRAGIAQALKMIGLRIAAQ